jgi:hypothetical protein
VACICPPRCRCCSSGYRSPNGVDRRRSRRGAARARTFEVKGSPQTCAARRCSQTCRCWRHRRHMRRGWRIGVRQPALSTAKTLVISVRWTPILRLDSLAWSLQGRLNRVEESTDFCACIVRALTPFDCDRQQVRSSVAPELGRFIVGEPSNCVCHDSNSGKLSANWERVD